MLLVGGGWVGGWFLQKIKLLRGSVLQDGICQNLILAENPRWSRVWQKSTRKACKDVVKNEVKIMSAALLSANILLVFAT